MYKNNSAFLFPTVYHCKPCLRLMDNMFVGIVALKVDHSEIGWTTWTLFGWCLTVFYHIGQLWMFWSNFGEFWLVWPSWTLYNHFKSYWTIFHNFETFLNHLGLFLDMLASLDLLIAHWLTYRLEIDSPPRNSTLCLIFCHICKYFCQI